MPDAVRLSRLRLLMLVSDHQPMSVWHRESTLNLHKLLFLRKKLTLQEERWISTPSQMWIPECIGLSLYHLYTGYRRSRKPAYFYAMDGFSMTRTRCPWISKRWNSKNSQIYLVYVESSSTLSAKWTIKQWCQFQYQTALKGFKPTGLCTMSTHLYVSTNLEMIQR